MSHWMYNYSFHKISYKYVINALREGRERLIKKTQSPYTLSTIILLGGRTSMEILINTNIIVYMGLYVVMDQSSQPMWDKREI
jgi:hypothetical protein